MPKETSQVKVRDHFHSKAHIAHSRAPRVLSHPPSSHELELTHSSVHFTRGGVGGTFCTKGSQERKTRSKKDKGVPKKARSPYMFFAMEWRGKFKKQNPNVELGPWPASPHFIASGLSDAQRLSHRSTYQIDGYQMEGAVWCRESGTCAIRFLRLKN